MSSVLLPITPPSLPSGYCYPADPQQFINDAVGGAVVNFDVTGATVVLKQPSQPLNTQRDKLWYNTTTGHTLYYDNPTASWVMPHGEPAGGLAWRIWTGDITTLQTYDGGSIGAAGAVSGPMWEVATAIAGRMPIGAGDLPDHVNGVVSVTVNGTGGHNELTVAKVNLPIDTIDVKTAVVGQAGVVGAGAEPVVGQTYGSDAISGPGSACDATDSTPGLSGRYYTRGQTLPLGDGTALNSVGPYYGVFFIKRTSQRIYYTS